MISRNIKRIATLTLLLFNFFTLNAQDSVKVEMSEGKVENAEIATNEQNASAIEMADVMRENGKINVVIAVLLIIFAGIIVYLVAIDRKLNRMEKKNNKN
jgi:CcmD family protein